MVIKHNPIITSSSFSKILDRICLTKHVLQDLLAVNIDKRYPIVHPWGWAIVSCQYCKFKYNLFFISGNQIDAGRQLCFVWTAELYRPIGLLFLRNNYQAIKGLYGIINSLWIHMICFPIYFRFTSLPLGQSYDCPSMIAPVAVKQPWKVWIKLTSAQQQQQSTNLRGPFY